MFYKFGYINISSDELDGYLYICNKKVIQGDKFPAYFKLGCLLLLSRTIQTKEQQQCEFSNRDIEKFRIFNQFVPALKTCDSFYQLVVQALNDPTDAQNIFSTFGMWKKNQVSLQKQFIEMSKDLSIQDNEFYSQSQSETILAILKTMQAKNQDQLTPAQEKLLDSLIQFIDICQANHLYGDQNDPDSIDILNIRNQKNKLIESTVHNVNVDVNDVDDSVSNVNTNFKT